MSEATAPLMPESQRILKSFMDYSGLNVLRERESVFHELVLERMKCLGHATLQAYEQALQESGFREREYQGLAEKLTIGETYFMRHPQVFDALKEAWTRELEAGRLTPFRIWSAAASIGCEAYSISILLEQLKQRFPGLQRQILASDLNREFLRTAEAACYGDWSFRSLPPEFRQRYFQPQGTQWQLRSELRQELDFFFCNLLAEFPPQVIALRGQLDALFCRNVLIYFDLETIRELAKRFYQMLAPGGWLVLGPSENNWELFEDFEAVSYQGAVLYRKPDGDGVPARLKRVATFPAPEPMAEAPAAVRPPKPARVEEGKRDLSVERIRRLLTEGQPAEALRCIQEALITQDLNPELHMLHGFVQGLQGNPDAADAHYKRALFLKRDYAAAQYLHAQLAARMLPVKVARKQLRIAKTVLAQSGEQALGLPEQDLSIQAALVTLQKLEEELEQ